MTSVRLRQALLPGLAAGAQPVALGVMGGGQLGRMFVQAAQRLGYSTVVLDPDPSSPAGQVSQHHIKAGYLDAHALAQLSHQCAAITTEFENVPAEALRALGLQRPTAPSAEVVAIAQDRHLEKSHFERCGVPCAPYALIDTDDSLARAPAALLPGILKTCRMGYDGKGQQAVADPAALAQAWVALGRVPCVLEQRLALDYECSVVLARSWDGAMVHYPPQRNLHRAGILAVTQSWPGAVEQDAADQAVAAARAVAEGLAYVGVLCVEFFVLQADAALAQQRGRLVVNEIAPRPHNSGHHTLDAFDVSQFDLQVRALAGLPLLEPRQHSPALMLNLLGDLWPSDTVVAAHGVSAPPWEQVLALPGAHLHLYGKHEPRPGRKMGHLTYTGADVQALQATALQACSLLGIEPF